MSQFNKTKFEKAFSASIIALTTSERVTKAELLTCSRTVLEALHTTDEGGGDIGYVNRLLDVLTPINRKNLALFFKVFTGFHFDDALKVFTKKNKKEYESCKKDALAHLDDPHFNVWTWTERKVKEPELKEFTLEAVTKATEGFLKKANANGISQAEVMRAIVKGGITADAILAILDEVGYDVAITGENHSAKSIADKVGEALV